MYQQLRPSRSTMQISIDLAIVIPPSRRKRNPPPDSPGIPARDLYLGRQHRAMVSTVDALRQARPDLTVALYIVSSHYGLLAEHDPVLPYADLLGSSPGQWRATGARLRLHEQLCRPLHEARFVLYCLSAAYLTAALAPPAGPGTALYLTAPGSLSHATASVIPAGRHEARMLGVSERAVRAQVLQGLCATIAQYGIDALASRVKEQASF